MKNNIHNSGLFISLVMVVLLQTANVLATPIPMEKVGDFVTPFTDKSFYDHTAYIISFNNDFANGAYKGGGAALTKVQIQSGAFGAGGLAGASIDWGSLMYTNSVNPVDLYLDLNMTANISDYSFGIGSISHIVHADFQLYSWSLNEPSFLIGEYDLTMNQTGSFHGTIPMVKVSQSSFFILDAYFEVTSNAYLVGPGVKYSSANGYMDFRLWADDPLAPNPNPIPEPATMLLFGSGLLGVVGAIRKQN